MTFCGFAKLLQEVLTQRFFARAFNDKRLLIAFDKDFGELVFRRGARASYGIVLFRITAMSSTGIAERVTKVLELRHDWLGQFSLVDDFIVRIRGLPKGGDQL